MNKMHKKRKVVPLIASMVISVIALSFFNLGCSTTKSVSDINRDLAEAVPAVHVTEFILGPGDTIEITVYRHDNLKRTLKIDQSGKIMYPMVGDITASGLSIFELRNKLRDGLSEYIKNPQIGIGIESVESQKIIVLGEVSRPGFFQAEVSMTVLEAISRAGGFTADGKTESVLVIRGGMKDPELIKLNLRETLKKGKLGNNIELQRDDIVYVPRTFISNVDAFFSRLSNIIGPALALEAGYYVGQQIGGTRGAASTRP